MFYKADVKGLLFPRDRNRLMKLVVMESHTSNIPAVNTNVLMSHPQFNGGLLLTSVACGLAGLLNYLLCPLSSLHPLRFLTM